MGKTMKKILCTLLVVVICLTAAPLNGFMDLDIKAEAAGLYDVKITLDLSDHVRKWMILNNNYGEYFVVDEHGLSDVKVTCVSSDGTETSQIIDAINPSDEYPNETQILNFYNIGYPKEVKFTYLYVTYVSFQYNSMGGLGEIKADINIYESGKSTALFTKSVAVNSGNVLISNVDKCSYAIKFIGITFYQITEEYLFLVQNTTKIENNEVSQTQKIPSGYNFKEDSYKFDNISETISQNYYTGMFGEEKGREIYEYKENRGNHGHCFGMALSTAATLIGAPSVGNYISWAGLPYTKLKSVNEGTSNLDLNMSAKDYIKYCYVYQYSKKVTIMRNSSSYCGITNVYNAVYSATYNSDSTCMIIILDGGPGGHAVYPIGVDGDDILVNDSNEPDSIKRINVNGTQWSYSAGGHTWKNTDTTISYVDDILTPYMNITYAVDVEGANVPKNESEEISGTGDRYAVGMKVVDEDALLIVDDSNSYEFEQSTFKLTDALAGEDVADEGQRASLYWLEEGTKVNAENVSESPSLLKVVGDDVKISAVLTENSSAEINIDENGENEIKVDTLENDEIIITFSSFNSEGEEISVDICGASDNGSTCISQSEEGLIVEGLSEGTVTLRNNDEIIATEKIEDAIGDIEITYEKDGSSDELEADYHTHSYASEETKSASCTETGSLTYICTCGDTYTESIAKLPHTYNSVITEATCEAGGFTTYTCTCGDTYTGDKTSATGHNYVEGVCENCGESKVDNCTHLCHKSGFLGFIWKIVRFIIKLFRVNPVCDCGMSHY